MPASLGASSGQGHQVWGRSAAGQPATSCCSAANPQRYSAISAAAALEDVLYRINLLEPAS